jgi:hypothetical protein
VARAASAHALSASRRPPPPPSFVAARQECLPAPPGLDWRAYRAGTAPHCRIVQSPERLRPCCFHLPAALIFTGCAGCF